MITVSLCMIVKNESAVLRRCLDSLKDLMDEIIIVDTGSTDNTKDIAAEYTDKIYDFEWVDDFSAARNFSFSKAGCDYIYVPDADEVLDEENRRQFRLLKEAMLPEIDIVQMKYHTVAHDTVLNVADEYRPKLFKRLREFTWMDPVHETVRLDPIVFDSDVVITHMPQSDHSSRDFSVFEKAVARGCELSDKVILMYATELYKCGNLQDLGRGLKFFEGLLENENERISDAASCILARFARMYGDSAALMKLALRDMLGKRTAEMCYEVGYYYYDLGDYREAVIWFSYAAEETDTVLDVHVGGDMAYEMLSLCYEKLAAIFEDMEIGTNYKNLSVHYQSMKCNWKMPVDRADL